MTNIRNTWEDLPSKNTPINAERLNNLEQNAGKGADFADSVSQLGKNLTVAASAEEARALIGATEVGHNHILASNNFAGFMSTSDKVKLDGVTVGATKNSADATLLNRANHTGTQAISTITGIVPIAQIPTGSTATTVALGNHTHANASTTVAGLMSAADKTKLDGLSNYTLPAATTSAIGGVLKATGVEDTTGEDLQALKTTVNELLANLRAAGIMY